MHDLDVTLVGSEFHINGFPYATKIIALESPIAKRFGDVGLHINDLNFCSACLGELVQGTSYSDVAKEAMWHSAVVHFLKCFGEGSRFQLSPRKVFKGEALEVIESFEYFKNLRNKHLVHDANSYAQAPTGAVLNAPNADRKIATIFAFAINARTDDAWAIQALQMLVDKVLTFARTEFDALAEQLQIAFESQPYEALVRMPNLNMQAPTLADIAIDRKVVRETK